MGIFGSILLVNINKMSFMRRYYIEKLLMRYFGFYYACARSVAKRRTMLKIFMIQMSNYVFNTRCSIVFAIFFLMQHGLRMRRFSVCAALCFFIDFSSTCVFVRFV